nr:hypothetical protein, mitochondrial [Tanacetum cinerariifolium]
MAKLCVFPDLPLSMDSAECAHKPEDPELRLGPPETPLERGKASLPRAAAFLDEVYPNRISTSRSAWYPAPRVHDIYIQLCPGDTVEACPSTMLLSRHALVPGVFQWSSSVRRSRVRPGHLQRPSPPFLYGVKEKTDPFDTRAMDCERKQVKVTTRGSQVNARMKEMSLQTLELGLVLIDTEGKTCDRTVWDLLLRALEASNQPGRSRSEVYYLTKGRVSVIRGFAIPVSLRRCSRPKSHVMLSKDEPPYHCEIAPSSLTIVSWRASPKRMPSLHSAFRRLWRTKIQIPGRNLINVELEKNEMASIINQLPKNELQGIHREDSIRKPLNEFNAEQQGQLKDLAINHFAVKNEIIAQMKYLYPGDEWEFTKVIREKFFQGRQKGREFDLEHLQKMLSALKERGKSSSCAAREWEGGSLLIGPAWILVGARPTEEENKRLATYERFLSEPWESRFCELARTGKEASPTGPTLKCPQTANPHQAASIAKCSATKQALPNTTDAEVGKPEVAKEVEGRKYLDNCIHEGTLVFWELATLTERGKGRNTLF